MAAWSSVGTTGRPSFTIGTGMMVIVPRAPGTASTGGWRDDDERGDPGENIDLDIVILAGELKPA
jgi:hypothetical protein